MIKSAEYLTPTSLAPGPAETYCICQIAAARLGLDVTGYEFDGWNMGAKIEADFYSGVSGVTGTATFRLRQAYVTVGRNDWLVTAGQAWHPMAADMPDVFSLNTGAPFGPFSRTPQVKLDYRLNDAFSLTGSAIWQMQYNSAGPNGASANYIKYSCTPEIYLGLNYKNDNLLLRAGVDMLSIKPRNNNGTVKVTDRIGGGAVRACRIVLHSPQR